MLDLWMDNNDEEGEQGDDGVDDAGGDDGNS